MASRSPKARAPTGPRRADGRCPALQMLRRLDSRSGHHLRPTLPLLPLVLYFSEAHVSLCSPCPSSRTPWPSSSDQARRRRIHVSILPVLVHARLHRPSASSSAVTDKVRHAVASRVTAFPLCSSLISPCLSMLPQTEAAREPPWLHPLRPCVRMPRCCSR